MPALFSSSPSPAQSTLKILLLTPPAPPPALSLVCRALLTSAGAGPPDPPTSLFSSHSTLSGEGYLVELETKAIRRFGKVSIVSYSRPSLMIIASESQFHIYVLTVGSTSV